MANDYGIGAPASNDTSYQAYLTYLQRAQSNNPLAKDYSKGNGFTFLDPSMNSKKDPFKNPAYYNYLKSTYDKDNSQNNIVNPYSGQNIDTTNPLYSSLTQSQGLSQNPQANNGIYQYNNQSSGMGNIFSGGSMSNDIFYKDALASSSLFVNKFPAGRQNVGGESLYAQSPQTFRAQSPQVKGPSFNI